jgi:ProP effector
MSNGSLKDQLRAVASQFVTEPAKKAKAHKPHAQKTRQPEKVQKPKPRWLEYAQYGVDLLKVHFPNCFKSMNEVKPLKKGIKEDLLKRLGTIEAIVTEDKACMVKSLSYYVNTLPYHKSVVAGAERLDLDGAPAGIVTAEEASYSVEKQKARMQAKKQAAATAATAKKEETVEPA